jgi:hypothetical protein
LAGHLKGGGGRHGQHRFGSINHASAVFPLAGSAIERRS